MTIFDYFKSNKKTQNVKPNELDNELDLSSIGKRSSNTTVYGADKPRNINACPNCGFIFDKSPARGRKCPECQKHFVVRTGGRLFNSNLLTPEQAAASECFDELSIYSVTVDDAIDMNRKLTKHFGKRPSESDLLWALIQHAPQKFSNDPKKLLEVAKDRFYTFARYQNALGLDPSPMLKNYAEASINESEFYLKLYKDSYPGQDYLYVVSNNCCATCASRNGKRIRISDAKEKQPIPFRDCTHKFKVTDRHNFCMAYYSYLNPIF